MKEKINFFCPFCDRHLSACETDAGRKAECPRCRKELEIPSKARAEREKLLRETTGAEEKKYALWLKSRLRMIKAGEKKASFPSGPDAAMPPWLKKAAGGAVPGKNPLEDIELIDMDSRKEKPKPPEKN